MKSYLFKKIENKFISINALQSIYDASNSEHEKVRSTDLIFNKSECLELQDDEQIIVVQKTQNIIDDYNLPILKQLKITALTNDFNASKKITIKNGKIVVIKHDTPERDEFVKLMENVSNLSSTQGAAFIYEQQTDADKIALRILPEIASYIFKDLFISALSNPQQTKVNSRVHNKTTVYELALEKINNATTATALDAINWNFLHPVGIVIDVNNKATKMLADPTVSDFAKIAINAAKDPTTGEIHLVKTLQELSDDS